MVSPVKTQKKIAPSFKGVIKAGQKNAKKKQGSVSHSGRSNCENSLRLLKNVFKILVLGFSIEHI